MKPHRLHHALYTLIMHMAAIADTFFDSVQRLATFAYDGLIFAMDWLMPARADFAMPTGHALRPTREVQYLKTGLHRLAQPFLMRAGDPEDGGDDDGTDTGEEASPHARR
jgi:hypothetical protein